ncbi:plakophilin-1 [Nematolebias whitei]|uniref:plakophilin-1 n=1 Tax=Nematolebias whitei TaxID=451745 RepID=UPI0018974744|nr:plakophilin-1 [Nematolebias whitei]
MMAPDPLRSATTVGGAEDTSLALPSDRSLSSGKQRVLEQVHSIKRTKSKHGQSSPLSPTSPSPKNFTTYNEFGTYKLMASKGNDLVSRTNSTMSAGYNKLANYQKSRSQSARFPIRRNVSSSSAWEQQINTTVGQKKPNGLTTSRSDPTLAPPRSPGTATMRLKGQNAFQVHQQSTSSMVNGVYHSDSQTRINQPPSNQIQTDGRMSTIKMSKIEQTSAVNSAMSMSDNTLKEAVELLCSTDENGQLYGANFIQHVTFNEESTKTEVYQLGGIPALVNLLDSSNLQISTAVAGALRNLVFKNKTNKLEVHHCGGIAKALNLLKKTNSTETKKQITGLLWNLSSDDDLKRDLIDTAMPALTENVVVPFISSDDDMRCVDSNVFHNTTGCLRNLSSGSVKERNKMRNCSDLINSLMSYVGSCAEKENPDEQSVENCVCILHNLTFQLEKECPEIFNQDFQSRASVSEEKKSAPVGCFSPRSSKVPNKISLETLPESSADSSTSGVKWLCHPKAIDNYLLLLESSTNEPTREASCGALQNLTTSKEGSGAVSQILLQKFKSFPILESLVKSENRTIQKTTLSLLDNMSRSRMQIDMARQMLPDLITFLDSNTEEMVFCDEEAVSLCHTVLRLMLSDSEVTKKIIDKNKVSQLIKLSENKAASYPKGSEAASVLLYNLWNDKNLHSTVKKMGLSKNHFISRKCEEASESLFSKIQTE